MDSYFFYYFNDVDGAVPFFEVVNCEDDAHAVSRCKQLLKIRNAESVEIWLGERRVDRLSADAPIAAGAAQLAANPPQGLASLRT